MGVVQRLKNNVHPDRAKTIGHDYYSELAAGLRACRDTGRLENAQP